MFQVIVADPPWSFADPLKSKGAAAHYKVIKNTDIVALPVKDYSDPNGCILALWVPGSFLQLGLNAVNAWGFTQKQVYTWVKVKKDPLKSLEKLSDALAFYMGRLFRQTHEICLIGTNNNKVYKLLKNKSQRSVSFAPSLRHSAKPEDLQDSLDKMFPEANKLELFARRVRPGWTCLGDEINGEDIRDSLKKL